MTVHGQKATPEASNLPRIGAEVHERKQGRNYSLVRLGPVTELTRYGVQHPLAPRPVKGKVFLKEPLGLSGMEISFGVLRPRGAVPFLHRHRQNEEVYLFVRGKGQIQIDGEVLDVEEGTAVRIAPGGVRSWRNTSEEELFYIVIQATEGSLTAWTLSDGEEVEGMPEWPGQE
jgi:mannose-6-phosphate isomerase-like protein (cupin superfamily)